MAYSGGLTLMWFGIQYDTGLQVVCTAVTYTWPETSVWQKSGGDGMKQLGEVVVRDASLMERFPLQQSRVTW